MSDDKQYALRLANGESLTSILNEARRLAWDECQSTWDEPNRGENPYD